MSLGVRGRKITRRTFARQGSLAVAAGVIAPVEPAGYEAGTKGKAGNVPGG